MKAGDRVLTYIVERELGKGGMGTVYLGRHTVLNQQVAIKVLSPSFAHNQALRERFIQEANIQAGLRHAGIVQLLTAEMEAEQPALVMEYIAGKSLDQVLDSRGALPVDDALQIMEQVFAAVGYAHRQGVVHRDLKPANVMVMGNGEAKVTDFGIAKILGSVSRTQSGAEMGTPHYMSPEQIRRPETADAQSDIYSLGCVFYEVLTGRPPFGDGAASDTENAFEIKTAHMNKDAVPIRKIIPDVPEWLEKLVMQSLEKEPSDRQSSCEYILAIIKNSSGDYKIASQAGQQVEKIVRQAKLLTQQAESATRQLSVANPNNLLLCPADQNECYENCWGTFAFTSGSKYVGEWQQGNFHGLGRRTWSDGSAYEGTFKGGNIHGLGTYVRADGVKCVGVFEIDQSNGCGTCFFPDGAEYVGEFKKDAFHGIGVLTKSDGSRFAGIWDQGQFLGAEGVRTGRVPNVDISETEVFLPGPGGVRTGRVPNADISETEVFLPGPDKILEKEKNKFRHQEPKSIKKPFQLILAVAGILLAIWSFSSWDTQPKQPIESDQVVAPKNITAENEKSREDINPNNLPWCDPFVLYASQPDVQYRKDLRSECWGKYVVQGYEYEGEWIFGSQTGYGIVQHDNGIRYVGNLIEGKSNGIGVLYFPKNDQYGRIKYEGLQEDDRWTKGKLFFADGHVEDV